jgi:hypothetical protein
VGLAISMSDGISKEDFLYSQIEMASSGNKYLLF